MVLIEAMTAFLSLDADFFIKMITNNIFWVLGFYTAAHIVGKGKNTLYLFVLLSLYVWALLSFRHIWDFSTGLSFPFLFFVYMAILHHFVAEPHLFGKRTPIFEVGSFYVLITWFTFVL